MNSFAKKRAFSQAALLASLFALAAGTVSGAESAGVASNAENANVKLVIRFFDKRVYYLRGQPILVQVSVTNNSSAVFRFQLSDDRAFSLDFEAREMTNRPVEASEILARKRNDSRRVFFREVALESGDSLSFVEDITNYVSLPSSGAYLISAKLYPDLLPEGSAGAANALVSNRLHLSVRPEVLTGGDGLPTAMDEATGANLTRERLPPDEVVSYTLRARQQAQWEKFFLYLNTEAMVTRNPGRMRQWRNESEEGRLRMLARYRNDLQTEGADVELAAVPTDFTVERTTYNGETGQVSVLERFKNGGYTERKRYTYYLRKDEGIWSIVDYTVVNLGIGSN